MFADEWMVIIGMMLRWRAPATDRTYVLLEFGRLVAAVGSTPDEQLAAGEAAAARFAGALPALGVTDATAPALAGVFEEVLAALDAHMAAGHAFLLGLEPGLGDAALGGTLYAHALRDPASGHAIKREHPVAAEWIDRAAGNLPARVRGHTVTEAGAVVRAPRVRRDPLAAADALPPSLLPLLAISLREQAPILRTAVDAVTAWARRAPRGARLPRTMGEAAFEVVGGGVSRPAAAGRRMVYPHAVWKLQRVLDHVASLPAATAARVDAALACVDGWAALRALDVSRCRLRRVSNRLQLDSALIDRARPAAGVARL